MIRKRGADTTQQEREPPTKDVKPKIADVSSVKPRRSTLVVLSWCLAAAAVAIYVVAPTAFYLCPWIRQCTVFLNFVNIPPFPNLSSPEVYGLECPHNFYVDSSPGIRLGVWHVPPKRRPELCRKNDDDWFGGSDPVILYLHGNGGSRAGGHRVALYEVLTGDLEAHVVAPDYRGYGDSSAATPTALGIVDDAEAAYRWLLKTVTSRRIVVWGHSLGTGVAVYLLERLARLKDDGPAGLVLEAPFDAVSNVAQHHPLSFFHRNMPYFDAVFVNSIKNEVTNFDSVGKITSLSRDIPVLILHARDDAMVPFELGKNLYEALHASRKSVPGSAEARLIAYDEKLGYGHKNICKDPGLPGTLKQFFSRVFQEGSKKAL